MVHSRHAADAKKVADEIGGDFFSADVSNAEQVKAMFEHIKNKHSELDVLINNVAHSAKAIYSTSRWKNGTAFWRST